MSARVLDGISGDGRTVGHSYLGRAAIPIDAKEHNTALLHYYSKQSQRLLTTRRTVPGIFLLVSISWSCKAGIGIPDNGSDCEPAQPSVGD
jgi:hypothetical protein